LEKLNLCNLNQEIIIILVLKSVISVAVGSSNFNGNGNTVNSSGSGRSAMAMTAIAAMMPARNMAMATVAAVIAVAMEGKLPFVILAY
jgi:7-cyano-7-deazaguanine synthase in queuosine biosynthesis